MKIRIPEKLNSAHLLIFTTIVDRFAEINISDDKPGKHYHMLADLNKMVFSAAPHLRQGWTEARRRRQGRQSVALEARDARYDKGQHFEQLLNWIVAFCAEF